LGVFMKVEVKNDIKQLSVWIDDLLHLTMNGVNAIHSYIDADVSPERYFIHFHLASGQIVKCEYDKRELWEQILKGL